MVTRRLRGGSTAAYAVENAHVLEEVAGMALDTLTLRADVNDLAPHLAWQAFSTQARCNGILWAGNVKGLSLANALLPAIAL